MPALCRDCFSEFEDLTPRYCPQCSSPRLLKHRELRSLSIAHIDCDAFYASVEKRENPSLKDKPVIIGGGARGVVSTACYIARISGVKSAMPMFKAKQKCPNAVIIAPRMKLYAEVSKQISQIMYEFTPKIEPLSLDEAFLDLTGTERLHMRSAAASLAHLISRIETELGISASVGLSHNKFLAKIASDLNKPRGFSIIGRAETLDLLAPLPVSKIWGAGRVLQEKLKAQGLTNFAELRQWPREDLTAYFGAMGSRLFDLCRGEDARSISSHAPVKSLSNETTFAKDIASQRELEKELWKLCEKLSRRAKDKEASGAVVTLKLKRANFKLISRQSLLPEPTQLADRIFDASKRLLSKELSNAPFRLLGVGLSKILPKEEADKFEDFLRGTERKEAEVERARDQIRHKFGEGAIIKGRNLD